MRIQILDALNRWASELSIAKKIFILLGLPLLINILLAVLFLNLQRNWKKADDLVIHSNEVLLRTESLYRGILEAQVNLRGLVFLDNPNLKDDIQRAIDRVDTEWTELRKLVLDNPEQVELVQTISFTLVEYKDLITKITGEMGERRIAAAMQIIKDLVVEGKVTILKDTLAEFTRREESIDHDRRDSLNSTYTESLWAVGIGCFALLLLTWLTAVLFNLSISQRFGLLLQSVRQVFTEGRAENKLSGKDEMAQIERAFVEVSRSLSERSAENEAFIYSVSHDMRSPLVNIQGFAEELKLSLTDLEHQVDAALTVTQAKATISKTIHTDLFRAAGFITAAVGRLSLIIDSLLKLSRIGKVEYQMQLCDLHTIVSKIVEALQSSIGEKKAEVEVDSLPSVYADPGAVDQIFSNLIGNAVKYLDPARVGQIKVGVRWDLSTPDFYMIYVNDNGLGFPESFAKKLFLPFQRYHAGIQGEGIGLALVHRIVERMKGTISAESELGKGSTFFIALPSVHIKSEFEQS